MITEISQKKNQKTQNNTSDFERFLYSPPSNNLGSKSSFNLKLTEPKEKKSLFRVLGISISFFELSNKKSFLNLSFELNNISYNELDSEFQLILKQEFLTTVIKKNKNKCLE